MHLKVRPRAAHQTLTLHLKGLCSKAIYKACNLDQQLPTPPQKKKKRTEKLVNTVKLPEIASLKDQSDPLIQQADPARQASHLQVPSLHPPLL